MKLACDMGKIKRNIFKYTIYYVVCVTNSREKNF